MLAEQHYSELFADAALPKHELLEIHRSKISLHHAKSGYNYPTIRLPYMFSKLAGLSTRIYQTVHEGALAFLVVFSESVASENSLDERDNVAMVGALVSYVFTKNGKEDPSLHHFELPENWYVERTLDV